MTKNDRLLFERFALSHIRDGVRVLEIGPDRHPSTLQEVVGARAALWDTLDFVSRTDVPLTFRTTEEYRYPVVDEAYDVVLAANVIEHVPRIWTWMRELRRIVRPGGLIITLNPVSWNYHPAPRDCWRIYPDGMRALCDEVGLEVVLSEWGSVELERLERVSPRRVREKHLVQWFSGVFVLWNAATRLGPDGSYDTITVARKPTARQSEGTTS